MGKRGLLGLPANIIFGSMQSIDLLGLAGFILRKRRAKELKKKARKRGEKECLLMSRQACSSHLTKKRRKNRVRVFC